METPFVAVGVCYTPFSNSCTTVVITYPLQSSCRYDANIRTLNMPGYCFDPHLQDIKPDAVGPGEQISGGVAMDS